MKNKSTYFVIILKLFIIIHYYNYNAIIILECQVYNKKRKDVDELQIYFFKKRTLRKNILSRY